MLTFPCVLCGRPHTNSIVAYPDGRRYLIHRACLYTVGWWS